jgi:hypothetical protein
VLEDVSCVLRHGTSFWVWFHNLYHIPAGTQEAERTAGGPTHRAGYGFALKTKTKLSGQN